MTKGKSRARIIAALNDTFRRSLPNGAGRILYTSGVSANGPRFVAKALASVAAFDAFSADNDPHGEHDFGSFEINGETLFWKIDYYDVSMEFGSENPADPQQTTRVLTVMLATEY